MKTPAYKLPDGWVVGYTYENGVVVLHGPSTAPGMVSIDFERRAFTGGSTSGPRFGGGGNRLYPVQPREYVGRGWAQMLVDDAVSSIESVFADGAF